MTDVTEDVFHAPALDSYLDNVFNTYTAERSQVERVSMLMQEAAANDTIRHFIKGNTDGRGYIHTQGLFELKPAIAALDAVYWANVMNNSGLLDVMPVKRRDEWYNLVETRKTPEFSRDNVQSTFRDLNAQKHRFMAEKVDGIFNRLSPDHITNSPQGFGKRMIVACVTDGSAYNFTNHGRCGTIDDLRDVVAILRGLKASYRGQTSDLVSRLQNNVGFGEWCVIDGGAMRVRLYKMGTMHIEIHPDLAWMLNKILAYLHPAAIPAEFRVKPKKKPKDVWLLQTPLNSEVLRYFKASFSGGGSWRHVQIDDKHVKKQVETVFELIGGVHRDSAWRFEYDVRDVVEYIASYGCIPDSKSHQYYPTPEVLAQKLIEIAEIDDGHKCLEPSAGMGAIAKLMPKDRTLCVEVSGMRMAALTAMGLQCIHMDFVAYAPLCKEQFDRILMNPPFDRGQWQAHLEAAMELLAPQGRLVAILPSGAASKLKAPMGFEVKQHGTFDNMFEGASVSVVIVEIRRV